VRQMAVDNRRRTGLSTPVILALLNIKFVLFTVGVAVLDFNQLIVETMHYFILPYSLALVYYTRIIINNTNNNYRYLITTDVMNFLVVLHSATNWLLFMQWRDASQAQASTNGSTM
jgi:hypothetical protein